MMQVVTAGAFSVLFVTGAYLETLWKKHVLSEYARMLCQSLSVFSVTLLCYGYLLTVSDHLPLGVFWENALDVSAICKVLLINTCLFLGPIVINCLSSNDGIASNMTQPTPYKVKAFLMAPIIEELHFRLLLLLVLDPEGEQRSFYLWTSSLLFSVSHSHRVFSMKIDKSVILQILFQMLFTLIFGYYAALVFYKTKCIGAAIVLHCYCNMMGPPHPGKY